MTFQLPELLYEINALDPYISGKTLEIHHQKHFLPYVSILNTLIESSKFKNTDLETIIKIADGPIFNYAALVWNHSFYFNGLSPSKNSLLKGPFIDVIQKNFGSVTYFKDIFVKSAVSLLGVGWVWLVWNPRGSMEIMHESNVGNPLRKGLIPLLTCDVWEHAYYLDYHNRREDYVQSFWKLINWDLVEENYNKALE
jgi:superoxide dismutase, Fe-Mn family